jgi:hypothetical protein
LLGYLYSVTDAPALTVSCPGDMTMGNCMTQAAINTAFNNWKAQFMVTSPGCNPTVTDLNQFNAPSACGGSVTINFVASNDPCNPDASCSATFTVADAPALAVSCPGNFTVGSCTSQAEVNVAFNNWKNQFVVTSPGCNPTVTDLDIFNPPSVCGGSVTINFSATNDPCNPDASCSATFTVVPAPALSLSCPGDLTIEACLSQAEVNAAFINWRNQFGLNEPGCDPTLTDLTQYTAPLACGGSTTVVFSATNDLCNPNVSCSATFTVTADNQAPVISCGNDAGETIIDLGCNPATFPTTDFIIENYVSATDNCGFIINLVSNPVFNNDCEFTQVYTFIANDFCGNQSTESCQIQVRWTEDTSDPVIECGTVEPLGCNPAVIPTAQDLIDNGTVTSSDNCGSEILVVGNSDIDVNGCEYTQTHGFKAVDACGNESEVCFVTVSWTIDTVLPELFCFNPDPLGCNPDYIPTAEDLIAQAYVTASDLCGGTEIMIIGNADIVIDGCDYSQTHRFIAIDGCGNESEVCFVTVSWKQDDTAPVLTCPASASIECTEDTHPTNTGGWATVSDDCSDGSLAATFNDEIVPGDCEGEYAIYRTWSATDDCNNTGTCVQMIKVVDNTPPVITPIHPDLMNIPNGSEITVECQNFDPDWDPFIFDEDDVTATDECSSVTITMTDILVEEGCTEDGVYLGFVSRWECRWIATDDCGNSAEYSFTMVVVDETPPVFTVTPDDIVTSCDNIPSFDNVEAIDNCSNVELTYVDSQLPGDCVGEMIIKRVWTATDYCGNASTYTQIIELVDNEAPTIYFHEPEMQQYNNGQEIFVDCEDLTSFIFNAEAAFGIDNCDYNPEVNYDFTITPSGNCANDGYFLKLESRWTITDDCGNSTDFALTFYSVDNTPPEFTYVPANVCTTSSELPAVESATAIDNCSSIVDIEFFELAPVDCGDGTVVERHWVATDLCGNSSTAVQMIIINDQTGPTLEITHPDFDGVENGGFVSLEADCSNADMLPDLEPYLNITDECSSGFLTEISFELMGEGDCISDGYLARYKLMIDVRDGCGNHSIYQYMVILVDTQAPVFVNAVPELFLECTEDLPEVMAEDNCTEVTMEVTQNEDFDVCSTDGTPLIRVFTATDECGNTATFEQVIHFYDNTPPVLVGVPDDMCGLPGPVADVSAFDSCSDEDPTINVTDTTFDGPCGSTTERTWTATDACGNMIAESQFFFSEDSTAPEISFNHPDLLEAEDGDVIELQCGELEFDLSHVMVSDNCTEDTDVQLDIVLLDSGDCSELGYFERYSYTWTATDVCGNATSITLYFKTIDTAPPGIHFVPDDLVLYCHEGPLPPAEGVMAFDNCSEVNLEFTETTQIISSTKSIVTRSWKAVDACGNSSFETQIITLLEPIISCDFPDAPDYIWCQSFDNKLTAEVEGGTGPYTYEWELIDCDGIIIGGFGTHTITYISGLTPMTFGVTITDINGCSTYCTLTIDCMKKIDDDDMNFSIPDTGDEVVSDIGDRIKVTIAPNPATDMVYIGFKDFEPQKAAELIITNIYGQVIQKISYDELPVDAQMINISEYPNGIYSLFVRQENQKPVEYKFIVAH